MKIDSKSVMISFRCAPDVEAVLHSRHARLVLRINRMVSIIRSTRPMVIEKPKAPSFSEYLRHLVGVAMRRLDHDLYFESNVRQALSVMVAPSNSDISKVLLSCHAVPNWSGWSTMTAFARGRKLQKTATRKAIRTVATTAFS